MFGLINKARLVLKGDRRGVTALEYGLIAAVIGGVVITAASSFGNDLKNAYGTVGTALTNQSTAASTAH